MFKGDIAYLLDVIDHGQTASDPWTKQHILEMMARDWPSAELVLRMNGVLPGTGLSEADTKTLRKARVNALFEYNGAVYMPRLGLSSAGTSTAVSLHAAKMLRVVHQLEKELTAGAGPLWDQLIATADLHNIQLPTSPAFKMVFVKDGIGVLETTTGSVFVGYGP